MKKELCEHCGASLMVNGYTMNKALVRALYKLNSRPNRFARELGFTRVEYSVYTKLKFWGLISPISGQDGMWFVTPDGRKFLKGELSVPRQIKYFRNKLTWVSEETVTIRDVFPTEESKQKYREMMTTWKIEEKGFEL